MHRSNLASPALATPDTLARPNGYKTKQELAYDALREAIITCRFPPGKRLLEIELAQQLGMSRSPVREALKRLSHEGLVTEIAHIGATVSAVGLDSLHELYLILSALEALACREATPNRPEPTLQAASDELLAMDRAVAAGDYLAWTQHNRAFHWLCRKDCGLPQLLRMLDDTQDQIHRFRLFRGAAAARAVQSEAEHAAIFAAMRARDGGKLEELVREHYLEGDRAFQAYLRSIADESA